MTATVDKAVADLRRANVELQRRLAAALAECDEALAQQQAIAEVLEIINSSRGDLAPVWDAMLEKATRLCSADFGSISGKEDSGLRVTATNSITPEYDAFIRGNVLPLNRGSLLGRAAVERKVVQIPDLVTDPEFTLTELITLGGARTALGVPLMREDDVIGGIMLARQRIEPFGERQIELVRAFADQAIIAIENARLITETREALDQQTATAEVLGVINASPGDLQPVFDAMVERAARLCEADEAAVRIFDGDALHLRAAYGATGVFERLQELGPSRTGRQSLYRDIAHADAQVTHIADVRETETFRENLPARQRLEARNVRTWLAVALRKDDALLGIINVHRHEVRPFSEKQIALLQNFAAQAVIAMENARLLGELRERTRDLQESLEYQTATSDVLKVMSGSAFDLNPVLETVVATAVRLCRADQATIYRVQDSEYRWAAGHSLAPEYERIERDVRIRPGIGTLVGRVALSRNTVQILDAWTDPLYEVKEDARVGGAHTMLGVPLLREGLPIGVIGLARRRVEPYTEKEIELVSTFADQAVIAIENARLLTETREARDTAERALSDLKTAQASLIQAEKMASLGQLTAGIAHEIKNPLNFVNNFASLSVELLEELKETTAPAVAALDEEKRAEADDTMELLTGNLEKIAEHGKRADNIVKSMLEHSRGVTGERREVDLNALIDEALNLAYHGARAHDQGFNITLERDFDQALPAVELAPQEITRVFLNLFGNGFYAANKRAREDGDGSFRPALTVATRGAGDAVEVTVRDNGMGIPPEIKDMLFQPFFTTKPTGEGTGLGLSISYDIITQQHGGTITVESAPGSFTEFTVRLPRRQKPQRGPA